jgi:hypothetical protein|tara:strand:- start:1589 stop:1909 length:321 start_codon:yes stop_codon:yes gene_type:complete
VGDISSDLCDELVMNVSNRLGEMELSPGMLTGKMKEISEELQAPLQGYFITIAQNGDDSTYCSNRVGSSTAFRRTPLRTKEKTYMEADSFYFKYSHCDWHGHLFRQ